VTHGEREDKDQREGMDDQPVDLQTMEFRKTAKEDLGGMQPRYANDQ
jgi:hypothetical protein